MACQPVCTIFICPWHFVIVVTFLTGILQLMNCLARECLLRNTCLVNSFHCLWLFYAKKLEDCIHYTFIFTFFVQLLSKSCFFFAHGLIEYRSMWPIDGILTGTISLYRSRSGSNGNKEVLHTSQISKTGISPPDIVKCYTKGILFLVGVLPLYRRYSQ